jgi:hypothetical protein
MGYGLGEQLEADIRKNIPWNPEKPWQGQKTTWRRYSKVMKARRERRRGRLNPECPPEYRRFHGWEY